MTAHLSLLRLVSLLLLLDVAACQAGSPRATGGSGGSGGTIAGAGGTSGVIGTGGDLGTGGASSGTGGRPPCLDTSNDPQNCGRCYNVCGTTRLASDQDASAGLVIRGGHAYWSAAGKDGGGRSLMTVPVTGGTPVTLATNTSTYDIVVDAAHVYFVDSSADVLMKVPIGGGAPTTVASRVVDATLAVDAANVYWSSWGPGCPEGDNLCGSIMKVSKAGGAATPLASKLAPVRGIAVDDANVYWTVQGTNIFEGAISKVPIAGGATTTLASKQQGVAGPIAVGAGNVYWSAGVGGVMGNVVMTMPASGGAAPTAVAGTTNVLVFALDERNIYWVESRSSVGSLKVMPLAGGPLSIVSAEVTRELAIDAATPYWLIEGPMGGVATVGAKTCESGECRCPANQVLCLGACVDAQTSAMRCGR